MIKKILSFIFIFGFLSNVNLSATQIVDENELYYDQNTAICANLEYTLEFDQTGFYEVIVTTEDNYILETMTSTSDEIDFIMPVNVNHVYFYIFEYDENGQEISHSKEELYIDNCYYDLQKDDYQLNPSQFSIDIKDNQLIVSPPSEELEDYKLYINALGNEESDQIKFNNNDPQTIAIESNIYQIKEQYSSVDGDVVNNFEVEIIDSNDYLIRSVEDSDLSLISDVSIFNFHQIAILLFLLFLLFTINIYRKILRRRYHQKKKKKLIAKRRRLERNKKYE